MRSVAATDLADLLRPKSVGEMVNVHVVESIEEPHPDFDAMRRTIEGPSLEKTVSPAREPEK